MNGTSLSKWSGGARSKRRRSQCESVRWPAASPAALPRAAFTRADFTRVADAPAS
jgi:hypothetical protein